MSSRKQLVEDHAETEDIRTTVNSMSFTAGLLWTHVRRSSREPVFFAPVLFLQSQPKVRNEGLAGRVDQNVGRLDVAVNQPFAVGVMEGISDRGGQFYRRGPQTAGFLPSSS